MADDASQNIYARVFLGQDQGARQPSDEPLRLNDDDEAEERAQKVLRDIASSESSFNRFNQHAKEDNRFYNGHQWDDIDRMRMEQLKRPAIVFNWIKPAIDAVSGLERLNRSDVRFVTRALDSNAILDLAGDLASEAVSTCDDICNGTEELSRVAKDAAITGMGWAEIHMDYNDDINGRVVYERIPWDEMRWDPNNARKENLEATEWRARKKPVPRRLFERLWGEDKLAAVDMAVPEMPFGTVNKYELVTPYYSRANEQANPQVGGPSPKREIIVIQYQWRDLQPVFRFIDEGTGEEQHFDQEQWDRLKKRVSILGGQPPAAVQQLQPVYRQGFYARGVELEDPVDLPGGFSLLCLTGQWDDQHQRWFGLVRPMIDPQKTGNKALASSLAFHISNAKGGVLFKPRAFEDPRMAQDRWSQPDAWIPVTDEADITKDIVPRAPSQLPPELPMFYQESQRAVTMVTGINPELVGQQQGQTPSQTAQQRLQQSMVVLGWYFDNLKRHHKEKAAMMLEFVREYWSQGQMIQVGGDALSQAVPLIKQSLPDRWHYSMVLDDSVRHNPDLKNQIWRDLMETGILQALMKFGLGQVILKLLKFSPFPSQLIQDIQRDIAQNPPPPPQKGRGGQQQGQPPGARGKPPDPPQLQAAQVALRGAQAQKALAQAKEIDTRSKLAIPKLALEAMQAAHGAQHERNVHQHQRRKDATDAVLKSMGMVGDAVGQAEQQRQQMLGQQMGAMQQPNDGGPPGEEGPPPAPATPAPQPGQGV